MLVIGTDTTKSKQTPSAQSLKVVFEAAHTMGLRTFQVPDDPDPELIEDAVYHFDQPEVTPAVFVGFIPSREYYTRLYDLLLEKNIRLINSPAEMLTAMEFDRFYPLLEGLTPASEVADSLWKCQSAAIRLGYPVFVKGLVKSQKEGGWKACVANDHIELAKITAALQDKSITRGKFVVRKLAELRHSQKTPQGFPCGREFRVFLHNASVLGYGYYWPHTDELSTLTSEEQGKIYTLAREAARRIGTPLMVVDVGQLKSGEWTVIEVGDAQFCGVSQMSAYQFWNALQASLAAHST